MECQDGKPRCSRGRINACYSLQRPKGIRLSADMASEGTMPGRLRGPPRVAISQRGAAPPLQQLGEIPEFQETCDPLWDTARSLLSIEALKRAQQNKAERLA